MLEIDPVVGFLVLEGLLYVIELSLKYYILSPNPRHLLLHPINLPNMLGNLVSQLAINPFHMLILRHILQIIILRLEISFSQFSLNGLLNYGIVFGHDLVIVLLKELELVNELG